MELIQKENRLAALEALIPEKCRVCDLPSTDCTPDECQATQVLISDCRRLEDEIIEMKAQLWEPEDIEVVEDPEPNGPPKPASSTWKDYLEYPFNVNDCIVGLNDGSVARCQLRINLLSEREKDAILQEFKKNPDQRFGDNLLVCLSHMEHHREELG